MDIGNILNNEIAITGILGSGAYGTVYDGISLSNNMPVAIKALKKPRQDPIYFDQSRPTRPTNHTSSSRHRNNRNHSSNCRHDHSASIDLSPSENVNIHKSIHYNMASPVTSPYTFTSSDLFCRPPISPASIALQYYSTANPLHKECALHQRVSNHENVLSLLDVFETEDSLYLVTEKHPLDLFTAITERKWYSNNDELIKQVFLQILDAVIHCHDLGVYHCDLKPENILVSDSGDVVVADFGLATEQLRANFFCGSTFYMSPERLEAETTSNQDGQSDVTLQYRSQSDKIQASPSSLGFSTPLSDTWSLGIILLNLISCRNPWKSSVLKDDCYSSFVRDPYFLEKIMPVSKQVCQILSKVLCPEEQRLDVKELRTLIQDCKEFTSPKVSIPRQLKPALSFWDPFPRATVSPTNLSTLFPHAIPSLTPISTPESSPSVSPLLSAFVFNPQIKQSSKSPTRQIHSIHYQPSSTANRSPLNRPSKRLRYSQPDPQEEASYPSVPSTPKRLIYSHISTPRTPQALISPRDCPNNGMFSFPVKQFFPLTPSSS